MPKTSSFVTHRSIKNALATFGIVLTNEQLPEITGQLVNDTRVVNAGDIFCAVIGTQTRGSEYIKKAVAQGASCIITECENKNEHGAIAWLSSGEQEKHKQNKVIQVSFYQLNQKLFSLAKAYYQSPQEKLNVIGITGTNGKTSTSQIIAKLLESCEEKCAVIGTNGAGLLGQLQPLQNTTPAATQLHQLMAGFVEQQCSSLAMEISSHALEQKRVEASLVDIAVYTNLSRDHLDYHQTMENYAQAKYQIFTQNADQIAVLNGDDKQAQKWLKNWSSEQTVFVYGQGKNIASNKQFAQATNINHNKNGVTFTLVTHIGKIEIESKLIGDFNIDNLLAAISVLLIKEHSLALIVQAITQLTATIGRMEVFSAFDKPTTVVDYAHTPDALENALKACRLHCTGNLWVVFGCGGDRDKGKRPLMIQAAENNADCLVITNDNPRTESPESIVNDMLAGSKNSNEITVMLDREQAVLTTLAKAKADDVILLAGKGHEDTIIIGERKISYNERALIEQVYLSYAVATTNLSDVGQPNKAVS
jgi:UDP-N-acetylmuramoyl-L-alanyl-D-glutamate--2,6-diaminopimelate ligase